MVCMKDSEVGLAAHIAFGKHGNGSFVYVDCETASLLHLTESSPHYAAEEKGLKTLIHLLCHFVQRHVFFLATRMSELTGRELTYKCRS